MPPTAIVMNMFYTGLGIARSLGEHDVRVIGLTAHKGIYGNYTRFADVRSYPDSREDPAGCLQFLISLGEQLGSHSIIFPTRDDDVILLDRFRDELARYFIPVVPPTDALDACLDKWETYLSARRLNVPVPQCWKIEQRQALIEVMEDISFPCVLKPLSSHHWRKERNWNRVGARKAICVSSKRELLDEYDRVSQADSRALLQEAVPGHDDQLFIVACYLDKQSELVASFTARKLIQIPQGFGTGCVVETTDRPEIVAPAVRLLQGMGFTGIAEVEFKWDSSSRDYKLIEVNPRPWDQHRLGRSCGVDLIHIAYCDKAGLPSTAVRKGSVHYKWIAEDAFLLNSLRSLWRRDGTLLPLWRAARGKRIYGIWLARDPMPAIAYLGRFLRDLASSVFKVFRSALGRRLLRKRFVEGTPAL